MHQTTNSYVTPTLTSDDAKLNQYRYYHFNVPQAFFKTFCSEYITDSTGFVINDTNKYTIDAFVNMSLNSSVFYDDYFSGSIDIYFVFNSLFSDTEFMLKHSDNNGISVIHSTDRGDYVFIGGLNNRDQQYDIVRNYEFKKYLRTTAAHEMNI